MIDGGNIIQWASWAMLTLGIGLLVLPLIAPCRVHLHRWTTRSEIITHDLWSRTEGCDRCPAERVVIQGSDIGKVSRIRLLCTLAAGAALIVAGAALLPH